MTDPEPPALRGLDLVLTAACDLNCSYCYQNSKQRSVMEWDVLEAALDLLLRSERHKLQVNFYGGEPLLQFGLVRRAVAHIEARRRPGTDIHFGLSTNGLLLDKAVTKFLAAHRIATQLSFDGVAAAQHLRAPSTFEALDGLLDRLGESHRPFFEQSLSVGVTLTVDNLPHLSDSFDYFLGKGVTDIGVMPLVTDEPRWNRECVIELDRQFSRIYGSSLEQYRRTKKVPFAWFDSQDATAPRSSDNTICNAARGNTLAIDVDGSVYGCVLFCRSFQRPPVGLLARALPQLELGHVTDSGLAQCRAAYPEAARSIGLFHDRNEKHSSYTVCRTCRHRESCTSCPAAIGLVPTNKDPHRVPDMQCALNAVALTWRERFSSQAAR